MKYARIIFLSFLIFLFSIQGSLSQQPITGNDNLISYQQSFAITSQNKSAVLDVVKQWMTNKYSPQNIFSRQNVLQAEGVFSVVSRNFFGKSTKYCNYTMTAYIQQDSIKASISKIHFSWYRRPMHKGDRGGWRQRSIEEVYPPEEKVPMEKRAYIQYIDNAEKEFLKVFKEIESLDYIDTTM